MNKFKHLNEFSQLLSNQRNKNKEIQNQDNENVMPNSIMCNETSNKVTSRSSSCEIDVIANTSYINNSQQQKQFKDENKIDTQFTEKDLKVLRKIKKLDIQILVIIFYIYSVSCDL